MLYIINNNLIDFNEKTIITITMGIVNGPDHKANLLAEGIQEITDTEFSIIKRKSEAWNLANTLGEQLDSNARVSMLYLLVDPSCPTWRQTRILAVQVWWSTLWTEYARVVQSIYYEENGLSAGVTVFDPAIVGNCPYSIWQITNE